MPDNFGYLLAHFIEDRHGYAERIHFSLSDGDDPLRWMPLWGGRPLLTSDIGTTGVRDPALVRPDSRTPDVVSSSMRRRGL